MNLFLDIILKYILRMNESFLIYNNFSNGSWEDQCWPSVLLFLFFFIKKVQTAYKDTSFLNLKMKQNLSLTLEMKVEDGEDWDWERRGGEGRGEWGGGNGGGVSCSGGVPLLEKKKPLVQCKLQ